MRRREFLRGAVVGGSSLYLGGCGDERSTPAGAAVDRGEGVPVATNLDSGWRFLRDEAGDSFDVALDDSGWESATLPHAPRYEALVTGPSGSATFQWVGDCWYRTRLTFGAEAEARKVFLVFEGAMNDADVWLDGVHLGRHLGGWLPFGFDLSASVSPGREHVLAVRLDNRFDPMTGPKPLNQLDFNSYGGLYRRVRLVTKARLHITDPILANEPASGGIFVQYPRVSSEEAEVRVQVHVRNDDVAARRFAIRLTLLSDGDDIVAEALSESTRLAAGGATEVVQTLVVANPSLWSPRTPHLHTLRAELVDGADVIDVETLRVGIRSIRFSADGFFLNDEPLFLRGTNRHQEYPYLGYALSGAAQRRDAKHIKEAGFDFVRLSHYPQDPAFLDACDEFGLAVMDCIPGWQYFNPASEFAEVQFDNCRRMIRRDRNHPCVVLWEVSLNETEMPYEFLLQCMAIAHEEYPGDQCYAAGWKADYDVFLQARQHGGCLGAGQRPCAVSEYGDWEYYAQNAGLNQEGWLDLLPAERSSRQLRWQGERALLQQALNFQEAHNADLGTRALADGSWVMFDYNRGYAADLESSGCMDIFRLPKFAYYFFRSQRDPEELYPDVSSGPMVFVASFWTAASSTNVRVFSNCEEVELTLDGVLLERRRPDQDRLSTNLRHPPFTFVLAAFEAGTLEAVGFVAGEEVARHSVRTAGAAFELSLWLDEGGIPFAAGGKDSIFVHAELRDDAGTVVSDAWENVCFGVTGSAALVGMNPLASDAGIASIVLQAEHDAPGAVVYALAIVRDGPLARVLGGAVSAGGDVEPFEVHVTVDGSAPSASSDLYDEPLEAERVRAVLVVTGNVVVEADSDTERFRVPANAPP